MNSPLLTLVEFNIIIASLGVVFFTQIIYAALCLTFVFVNIALLYLLLNAEFLAAAQVLIYVGAVNVLIVFAIMLVNKPSKQKESVFNLGTIISGIFSIILFFILLIIISLTPFPFYQEVVISKSTGLNNIGHYLLTEFFLPFELLSILLLVALVGAITIVLKEPLTKT